MIAPNRRQSKSSSVIRSAAYDHDARILQIEFRSGRIYDYRDVPPYVFLALTEAESAVRFFNTYIRLKYHSERLRMKVTP